MSTGTEHPTDTMTVEVAYATPEKQLLLQLLVPLGCTVEQAISMSGIQKKFPGMELDSKSVGVFSRKVALDHRLNEGDRVEIYRPLVADPKESRRQRAQTGKKISRETS